MKNRHSFDFIKLGALGLGCATLALSGPVFSAQIPSIQYQPYHIVSSTGECMVTGANLVFRSNCNSHSIENGNSFYFLWTGGSDKEMTPSYGMGYSVRIVNAVAFDKSQPAYRQIAVRSTPPTPYYDGNSTPNGNGIDREFMMEWVARSDLWVPIAIQQQFFPVTGKRTFRYGPAGGPYTYRTVEGSTINGLGQCTAKFFPGAPAGNGMTCDVKSATSSSTPSEVQFRYMRAPGNTCLTTSADPTDVYISLAPCTPVTPGNVWKLVPAKYGVGEPV